MGKVILGVNMSLDGFINDRDGSVSRLYPDFEGMQQSALMQEAIRTTGAVVMGRRAYSMGDPDSYADAYEFQVPIFVLTHHAPDKLPRQSDRLTFTFVTDGVERLIERAKAAAGDRNVMIVGGASVAQQCLRAGLVDELEIGIVPVLLGDGLRFFDLTGIEPVALERIQTLESAGVTVLRYRVIR